MPKKNPCGSLSKLLLVILLFCAQKIAHSQAAPNNINLPQVIPPNPVSQEFQKFLGYPVSGATGTADINIPLHTLELSDIKIPFTLSYHSSGIKVDQTYGSTGYGWSMFPFFKITRTIMGKSDEAYRTDSIFTTKPATWTDNKWKDYLVEMATSPTGVYPDGFSTKDGQFDIFSFSLPNYSGNFILKRENGAFKAITIPYTPLDITVLHPTSNNFYLNGFEVIDDKGVKYIFGYDGAGSIPYHEYNETSHSGTSGWMLKQIILPGINNIVTFHYGAATEVNGTGTSKSFTIWDDYVDAGQRDQFKSRMGISQPIFDYGGYAYRESIYPTGRETVKYLSSVEFANGKIELSYSDNYGLESLENIKVINSDQKVIKTIVLTQQDHLLTKVAISGQGDYKMEYNPQRFQYLFGQDRWGYYNNQPNALYMMPQATLTIVERNNGVATTSSKTFGNVSREPDSIAMKANILEKITYPTGGWSKFHYEPHKFYLTQGGTNFGGGLRIRQLDTYDPVADKTITKTYRYGSVANPESGLGTIITYPRDDWFIDETRLFAIIYTGVPQTVAHPSVCRRRTISPNHRYRFFGLTLPVWYENVTEYTNEGKVVSVYQYERDVLAAYQSGNHIHELLTGIYSLVQNAPQLKKKTVYKNQGGSYVWIQDEENIYQRTNAGTLSNLFVRQNGYKVDATVISNRDWLSSQTINSQTPAEFFQEFPFNPFHVQIYTGKMNLFRSVQRDSAYGHLLIRTTDYRYDPDYPFNLTSIAAINSSGDTILQNFYYPTSTSIPGLTAAQQQMATTLKNNNRLTSLIQTTSSKNTSTLLEGTLYQYKDWTNNIFEPEITYTKTGTTAYESRLRFHNYDDKGNVVSVSKENDAVKSYIWDYNKAYPIAEIVNASGTDFAYTSFEADGKGNWSFTGLPNIDAAVTGKKVYSLSLGSITKTGLTAGKIYIVSYWTKSASAFSISGTQPGYPVSGRMVNGWRYFEHKVSGQTQVNLTGTGLIDELRLFPANALMTTSTYQPLVGIMDQCDATNRIMYYEYDNLNRLMIIRNQDKNVVKKFCYNYAGQPEDCSKFSNDLKSQTFTKSCSGTMVGSPVRYAVAPGTYVSSLNQADADQMALNDIAANGQNYANQHGSCYCPMKITNLTGVSTSTSSTFLVDGKAYSMPSNSTPFTLTNLTPGNHTFEFLCTSNPQLRKKLKFELNGMTYYPGNIITTSINGAANIEAKLCATNCTGPGTTDCYYSVQKSGTFQKDDCTPPQVGTMETYTIPADTYVSSINQHHADQLAQNAVNSNGPNYANTNGNCYTPGYSVIINNTTAVSATPHPQVKVNGITYTCPPGITSLSLNLSAGTHSFAFPCVSNQQLVGAKYKVNGGTDYLCSPTTISISVSGTVNIQIYK